MTIYSTVRTYKLYTYSTYSNEKVKVRTYVRKRNLKNRTITTLFEIQIVKVELINFNPNANQEEV